MRKCRRVLPIITLCLFTVAAYSQQSWQGNAAAARGGEFAAPGLYAASNAFPENTAILVQNAQSGQSVRVTVTQRIPGTASVFLLLSEEAGKQIGLTGSQVIRVRASVVSTLGTDLSDSLREEPYSPDPDLNPSLSVTEEQLLSVSEAQPELETGPTVEIAQAATPEPEPAAEPSTEQEIEPLVEEAEQAVAGEPAGIAETPTEEPAARELTPEEKRLQELADRIPQKQLYMPPRQQEVYALAPEPSPVREMEEEIAAAEQPAEEVAEAEEAPPVEEKLEKLPEEIVEAAEVEEEIEAVEEGPPRVSMLGPEAEEEPLEVALPGPEAAEPEKPSPEGTRLPAPEEETPLTMAPEEPPTGEIEEAAVAEEVVETPVTEEQPVEEVAVAEEEEQPAVEEPAAEVAIAEAAAEEPMPRSAQLPSRTYFVQLGAYSTRTLAEKLAGDLTKNYSVTILPASSGGRNFYKVLVGPLNVDESGTLLYQFRSRGFKDAFIKYVE
jgi:rare lipoprotein A (peptidoglycan hydrolase)